MAGFIVLAKNSDAITRYNIWVMGEKVRVYFDLWSQNSLDAFHLTDKWFFDSTKNEIYTTGDAYGRFFKYTIGEVAMFRRRSFSGAQTRDRIITLSRIFYEQKTTWD